MLKNRLGSEPGEAPQNRFSPSESCVKGTFNIDFKIAFNRVWHVDLWAIMRKYSINANLVCATERLFDSAIGAVQMNGSTGEWSRPTVGFRQGCFLSSTLFNIGLEKIMSGALEGHDGKLA